MNISIAEVQIKGLSPYSPSKFHDTPKLEGETSDNYEKRTWRERVHADAKGNLTLPPMAFKNGLGEATQFFPMKIPGQRNATYTKHFEAGVMVVDEIPLTPPVKKSEVEGEWLLVPADGRRGGTTRVKKCFAVVRNWEATVRFHVLDPTITESVFATYMDHFGAFIGVGRFRPRRNGFYGRFEVKKIKWS
jgi:hypothetical protein